VPWEPPSARRAGYYTAERCPECGEALYAGRRGTWRVCTACKMIAVPAAVSAPYARGDGAAQRKVVSTQEKDAESRELAVRRGDFKREIERQLAGDQLTPQSRDILEWYADEVGKAPTAARLDDLIEQARGERLRSRHFWQGEPAAIEAPAAADLEDQDDEDDGETYVYDAAGQLVPARWSADGRLVAAGQPPGPGAATGPAVEWASELAAREWVFQPHGAGLCQLVHLKPHGWDVPPEECIGRGTHPIPGGAVCDSCYQALTWRPLAAGQ